MTDRRPERREADEDPALRILMAEYQAGSVDAFARLHDALVSDLRTYLTALSRDPVRADDLVQETFLQMHRARAVHTPGRPVRPWVFAIAKRVFLMHRRSAVRRADHEGRSAAGTGAASTTTEVERLHARRQLESALGRIPPDGRRVFVLHHLLGLSFKEVGTRVGITPGAARIRSSRAVSIMRTLLRGNRDG